MSVSYSMRPSSNAGRLASGSSSVRVNWPPALAARVAIGQFVVKVILEADHEQGFGVAACAALSEQPGDFDLCFFDGGVFGAQQIDDAIACAEGDGGDAVGQAAVATMAIYAAEWFAGGQVGGGPATKWALERSVKGCCPASADWARL